MTIRNHASVVSSGECQARAAAPAITRLHFGTADPKWRGRQSFSRHGHHAWMRRLYYAGGTVLVGDRTCKAVLRYARALAEAHQSDVITIPIASEGGGVERAHFLIGPASQLFSVPVENSADAPFDQEVIEHLERETRNLHPATPAWDDEMTDIPNLDFLEFGEPDH